MQLTTPLVGAVFAVSAILSSCLGDPGTDSEQAFTNSDAPVGATIAAVVGDPCGTSADCDVGEVCVESKCAQQCMQDNATAGGVGGLNCNAKEVFINNTCDAGGDGSALNLPCNMDADCQATAGSGAMCTNIPKITATVINNDGCDFVGDTATVDISASIHFNADRFDIGVYSALDGGDALSGVCSVDIAPFTPDPFWDADGTPDTCGDVDCMGGGGCDTVDDLAFDTLTLTCVDVDGDGNLDWTTCFSWRTSGNNGLCTGPSDVFPGTVSKCFCETLNLGDIPVPKTIKIVKDLTPDDDAGLFNLRLNDFTEKDDAGEMDMTLPIPVDPGSNTVSETAGTDTNLSAYSSNITCVETVGTCTEDSSIACTIDTTCAAFDKGTCNLTPVVVASCTDCTSIDVTVPDQQSAIVCTITNERMDPCDPLPDCTGFNTDCGIASCDPDGEVGNCDTLTAVQADTVCRTGSGDQCDPDEVCDGVNTGACPDDAFDDGTTVCRQGSGDVCDPDELCTGVVGAACPDDIVESAGTVCNPGSGDVCDPDEECTGVVGAACPDDIVESAGTVCNPGSGDVCDPAEMCLGVADAACPDNVVAFPGTVCNPGSGDVCDPDEVCTGVPFAPCPADTVAGAGTVCNAGSGDLCDPNELCTGVADQACPADTFEPATTVCNAGSGDLCDPDELCTGVADQACPADTFEPATTVCNAGSGDLCDPDELCTGVADQACPADTFEPVTTVCNAGSGDLCDPDELCTGVADQACPADTFEPATTVCNAGSGDLCDPDELCTGVADQACPADTFEPVTTVCNAGSGDLCDPDELCTGVADQACPADTFEPATTVCNAGSGDLCDPDELCTGNPGEACPSDTVATAGTVCNAGSDDLCDPDELCTGVADQACPADTFEPATTVCNAGSDDLCDPDELCTGNPGEACPSDTVATAGTVCNAGSDDLCDPDELCTGVAGAACPADSFEPATTVCNAGSDDLCDPDELCTGVAGAACPADSFEPATTVCNAGSDDLCDPDELCTGVAGAACPADSFEPATTVCNAGSDDLCDPDELCPGTADGACPSDTVATAGTVCNAGSGDLCDPDELCTGVAGAACPADSFEPATTVCNAGSDDLCDPDELCTGNPGEACPADSFDDGSTVCRMGSGDDCDPDETCPGTADGACPADFVEPATTVCRVSGTGDLICDPPEKCTGVAGEQCPGDVLADEFTPCGDDSDTACTDPDTCDDAGNCQPNNEACAAVTDSELCDFDVSTKGACSDDRSACDLADTCIGSPNGYCAVTGDLCDSDGDCNVACPINGGTCEPENQFKLVFTPDGKIWPGYKLNASNPGQTFYNLIYDGPPTTVLTISIPYPYVTVGATPVHVYDGEEVGNIEDDDCFMPPADTLGELGTQLTIDDWIDGGINNPDLTCNLVCGPDGAGFCTFMVDLGDMEIPDSGQYYVNVHLDYGLKGVHLDANPCDDMITDRYDANSAYSTWGQADDGVWTGGVLVTRDAYVDEPEAPLTMLGLSDCRDHVFSHDEDGDLDADFSDTVQNLNLFKRIKGAYGFAGGSQTGLPGANTLVELMRNDTGEIVATGTTDEDGAYALTYKHKGKRAAYTVSLQGDYGLSGQIELKANGWGEAVFDIDTGEVTTVFSEPPGGGGKGGKN